MKKILLTLVVLCLSLTTYAQRFMQIHMGDSILSVRTDEIDYVDFIEREEVEHDYVDLGLPSGTLWATCNVGAESPEQYGDYFSWGEVTGYNSGKTSFPWSNYKYCNGSTNKGPFTKYCIDSDYGIVDNKTELDVEDDAAYVNWGSNWRMPSCDQINELYNSSNTTTTWTTQNGVNGTLITSKANGNSIFLPAAGCRYDDALDLAGSYGVIWTRTLTLDYTYNAYDLYFNWNGFHTYVDGRCSGRSVRPVRNITTE